MRKWKIMKTIISTICEKNENFHEISLEIFVESFHFPFGSDVVVVV